MAKKKSEKYAIILDTNCFGKISRYNFEKSNLTICLDNLCDYDNINVFMPSIVYEEVKKHIVEAVDEIFTCLNNSFIKQYIEIDKNQIINEKIESLNKLVKKYNIASLDCNKYTDLKTINNWYFKCRKPFSKSKPKEFPDAMILSSTINYFGDSDFDHVIIISSDDDMIGGFKENTNFEVLNNIQDVFLRFVGISGQKLIACKKYICDNHILEKEELYDFFSYDSNDSFQVDSIVCNDIEKLLVIDHNDDKKYTQLMIKCNIDILGDFSIIDHSFSVYDHEDPECSVFWFRTGEKISLTDIYTFISLHYDEKGNIIKYTIDIREDIVLNDYLDQLTLQEP